MKQKRIKIDLLPKDFKNCEFNNNEKCALARASRRFFKQNIFCGTETLIVCTSPYRTLYGICKSFTEEDYNFVKEKYEKDPKAEKVIYYVELEEL